MNLIRSEFAPDVLATQNMTGRSRNENGKPVIYPKLNEHILNTIFKQIKMQFSGFNGNHQDHMSATGKAIQSMCQNMFNDRHKLQMMLQYNKKIQLKKNKTSNKKNLSKEHLKLQYKQH